MKLILYKNDFLMAKKLIARGADINYRRSSDGMSVLMLAI
jgi:hypothetical protein